MSVERDEEADKYSVYAIFNMKKDAADDLYRTVFNNGEEDPDNLRNKIISNFINSIGCYRGDF